MECKVNETAAIIQIGKIPVPGEDGKEIEVFSYHLTLESAGCLITGHWLEQVRRPIQMDNTNGLSCKPRVYLEKRNARQLKFIPFRWH